MRVYLKKKKNHSLPIILVLTLAALISLFFVTDRHLRNFVAEYASSVGKTKILNVANESIAEIYEQENIEYNKLVKLTRNQENIVTSVEINTNEINRIKAIIGIKISEKLERESSYPLRIHMGTLIGNEFTVGRGPKITFKMKLNSSVTTDFSSHFYAAGINQVLHQIHLNINMSGNILIPGFPSSFSSKTNYILAETVIVGIVPDAYTNVSETDSDDIAEDIFNFGQ